MGLEVKVIWGQSKEARTEDRLVQDRCVCVCVRERESERERERERERELENWRERERERGRDGERWRERGRERERETDVCVESACVRVPMCNMTCCFMCCYSAYKGST